MPPELKEIQTIIVLMMENRSFDHMLGYLRLPAYGGNQEIDGVRDDQDWLNQHSNSWQGCSYQPGPLKEPRIPDPPHERADIATQMGQPDANRVYPLDGFIASARGDSEVMRYQVRDQVPILDFLARNFRICDQWFAPLPASTQPNRLMAMAGYTLTDGNVDVLPNHVLVYDWLTAHNVRWRVYHQGFFPFFSIMPRWLPAIATSDRFRSFDRFATDMELESHDTFPEVIFVEPAYTDAPHEGEGTDDHSPSSVAGGQRLMLDVYSALINSPRWNNSVMIITYDEHGGFYDHVQPLPVETIAPQEVYPFFPTTGLRVPTVVVSPLVSAGSVCHGNFDHTSVLKFLGQRFGMGGGYSPEVDKRQLVGSVADILDLPAPRDDRPNPPDPSALAAPPQTTPIPLPNVNNNVEAFKQAASQMTADYAHQLATKFPESRRILGF